MRERIESVNAPSAYDFASPLPVEAVQGRFYE